MLSPKLPLCSWMTVWMTHVLPPPHFLRLKPHVLGCGDKEKDGHDTGSSNPFISVEELRRQSIGKNGESQYGSPRRLLTSEVLPKKNPRMLCGPEAGSKGEPGHLDHCRMLESCVPFPTFWVLCHITPTCVSASQREATTWDELAGKRCIRSGAGRPAPALTVKWTTSVLDTTKPSCSCFVLA